MSVDGTVVARGPAARDRSTASSRTASTTVDVALARSGDRIGLPPPVHRRPHGHDQRLGQRQRGRPAARRRRDRAAGRPVPPLPRGVRLGVPRRPAWPSTASRCPCGSPGPCAELLAGNPLPLRACGDLPVDPRRRRARDRRDRRRRDAGLDVDSLVLRSGAGGGATPVDAGTDHGGGDGRRGARPRSPPSRWRPTTTTAPRSRSAARRRASRSGSCSGRAHNVGLDGRPPTARTSASRCWSTGSPTAGWSRPTSSSFAVDIGFAPQRRVDIAIAISAVAAVVCLALLIRRPRVVVDAPSSLAEPYSSVLAFRYDGALPDPAHRGVDRGGRRPARPRDRRPGGRARASASPPASGPATRRSAATCCSPARWRWPCARLYVLYIQVRWSPDAQLRLADRDEAGRTRSAGWRSSLLVADVIVDRVWQSRRTDTS